MSIKFISLFKIFSNSNLGFVKLHSWYYHIREFGGLNGMCTETYEFLHKFYVKQSYCLSSSRTINKISMYNSYLINFFYF